MDTYGKSIDNDKRKEVWVLLKLMNGAKKEDTDAKP
jgi:hypothetical protein